MREFVRERDIGNLGLDVADGGRPPRRWQSFHGPLVLMQERDRIDQEISCSSSPPRRRSVQGRKLRP
jgi:hypothetical protein